MEGEQLTTEGITTAKAAQQARKERQSTATTGSLRNHARQLLLEAVEKDDTNVQAWLWLSTVMDNPNDQLTCLRNVLVLEPDNASAQQGMALLEEKLGPQPQSPDADPAPLPQTRQSPCPFCRKPVSPSDTACPHCETPLVMDCPVCKTLMDVDIDTCTCCGHPLGDYQLGSVYFYSLAIDYHENRQAEKALEEIGDAYAMLSRPSDNGHTPFGDIAIVHPVICAVDRGIVKGMLAALYGDTDVNQLQSLPQGDTFCATSV